MKQRNLPKRNRFSPIWAWVVSLTAMATAACNDAEISDGLEPRRTAFIDAGRTDPHDGFVRFLDQQIMDETGGARQFP